VKTQAAGGGTVGGADAGEGDDFFAARAHGPAAAIARAVGGRRPIFAALVVWVAAFFPTRLDDEIDLVVLQPQLAAGLDAHFEEDLARSERIVGRRWRHRPAPQRAREATAGLMRREV
jgi:hypothetical protein